uniref:non-specific serine/threonine protein kinase n=1 Tax=Fagus sylvatica TaxID=28930 RepID=A0A2N9J8G3_FAGSY
MDQSQTLTAIRGTKGYVAPEWFRNMAITTKVDVYSYGVMLLEMICCQKSVDMESVGEEAILTDWAYDCYTEGALDALVEYDVEALNDREKLERFVMVAIWCIQEDVSLRPSMRRVTQMLEGVVEVLVPPCPYPFSMTDNPAPRGSKVELLADRGLVLTSPQGVELWKPNTFVGTVAYGVMNNTGNFELQDSNFNNIWESFKNPTDTLLPTQSMERGGVVSSRQSETNFSKGRFQLRLQDDGNLVLNSINLPTTYANEAYYESGTLGDSNTSSPGSGICGYNSICTRKADRRPMCTCPNGYSLLDPNDQYGSCKPDFIQGCEEDKLSPGKDLYTFEELIEYRLAILRLCDSCWKKKLPLSNGRVDSTLNGGKAFIKIRKDNSTILPDDRFPIQQPKTKNQDNLILIGSVLLGGSVFVNFILIGAIFLGFFFIYHKKIKRIATSGSVVDINLRCFTYKELVEATNGFKEELGKGAFGVVYKGAIQMSSSSVPVAVKKLRNFFQDSEREFKTELNVIGQTHHKDLVRLLGFCDEGLQRLLVYEFMSNGTLASFLFGDLKPSWNQRIQIAFGIARGLLYLHEECSTQIIHCDIKPQNILLDDYYNARIADFGLAKLLMMDQKPNTYTHQRNQRIICCRRSVDMETCEEETAILTDWAYDCYREGSLDALVEYNVEALADREKLERFVMIAIWCIQEDPSLRPTMRRVTQMLEGVVEVLVPPCPNPFGKPGESSISSLHKEGFTVTMS